MTATFDKTATRARIVDGFRVYARNLVDLVYLEDGDMPPADLPAAIDAGDEAGALAAADDFALHLQENFHGLFTPEQSEIVTLGYLDISMACVAAQTGELVGLLSEAVQTFAWPQFDADGYENRCRKSSRKAERDFDLFARDHGLKPLQIDYAREALQSLGRNALPS